MITVKTINDELLSSERYEIYINNEFYVGNLKYSGLKYWKERFNLKCTQE